MAERPVDERVLALVRREMSKNADLSSSELFEKAKSISPAMRRLTIQQFHGRYPLRVSRELAKAGGGAKRRAKRGRPAKAARKPAPSPAPTPVAAPKPAAPRPAAPRTAAATAAAQDSIRKVLLELAQAVASSDAANLVMVVGQIDRYVDRIQAAR
jgi:hypothetical protein